MQGFTYIEGVYYDESLAPVTKLLSFSVILTIAAEYDLEVHQSLRISMGNWKRKFTWGLSPVSISPKAWHSNSTRRFAVPTCQAGQPRLVQGCASGAGIDGIHSHRSHQGRPCGLRSLLGSYSSLSSMLMMCRDIKFIEGTQEGL